MYFIVPRKWYNYYYKHKEETEKMDDNMYKLYNFVVSAVYYETDVPYVSLCAISFSKSDL